MFSSPSALLDLLQRARRALRQHTGACFGVWGEAGIGKTHTINAVIRELAVSSLTFKAQSLGQALVLDLPRTRRKVPKWASNVFEIVQNGGHVESRALIGAVSAHLAALAPFVVHLEDLHEASSDQLVFWLDLARALKRFSGVMLLASSRTVLTAPFESTQLLKLGSEQSNDLLEAELGAVLPQRTKLWIFNHARGNPLFTLEFLRHVVRQGFLWNDGLRWRWREPIKSLIPGSVEAVIELVLEEAYRLEYGQELLGALALTDASEPQMWSALIGIETSSLKETKIALERLGVLRNSEFTHPLYRELVLRDLPSQFARTLARAALELPQPDPARLEMYFDKAQLEPQVALRKLELAWLEAEQRGNPLDAARLKARAALLCVGERRVRLVLAAFDVFKHNYGSEAIKLLEALLPWELDNPEVIESLIKIYAWQGRRDEGQRLLEQLSERQHNPSRWRKRLLEFYLHANRHQEALQMLEIEADLLESLSPKTVAHVAFALGYEGRFDRANHLLDTAQTQSLDQNEALSILTTRATLSVLSDRLERALAQFTDAACFAEKTQSSRLLAGALYNRATVAAKLDRFAGAVQDLKSCLDLMEAAGDTWAYAEYLAEFGALLVERGEFIHAEDALLQARAILEIGQPSSALIVAECGLVMLYCTWEVPHARALTIKYARDAWRHANQLDIQVLKLQPLSCLAQAEARFGQPGVALEHVQHIFEMIELYQFNHFYPDALWIQGVVLRSLGQLEQASAVLKQASKLMQDRGAVLTSELIRLELDCMNNDLNSARQKLELFQQADYGRGSYLVKRYFPMLQTVSARNISNLNLGLLGKFNINRGGQDTRLQGAKRKVLLALLAEACLLGRDGKTQVDLLDALYPNQAEPEALAALHQLVRQTRVLLGETSIATLENGYGLRGVNLDMLQFIKTGETRLWRGVYLEDVALEANPQVLEVLRTKLRERIWAQLETDPPEAARAARILFEMDAYDLNDLALTVRALQNTKQYSSLKRLYVQARVALLEVGEHLPELWTDFLKHRANEPVLSAQNPAILSA